jgi:uncharacterized protein (TIGR03086 family)
VTGRATDALELLERALSYARISLSTVGPDRSGPTPCAGWSLTDLLAHMDDGLDAFLEAAGGVVRVPVGRSAPARPGADLELLQTKACDLLGVWSGRTPPRVEVGDRSLPAELLVRAAALEIAVHGWDVARATGADRHLPEDLAQALLPVAGLVVAPADRPERFGPARAPQAGTGASEALLGFLGRH